MLFLLNFFKNLNLCTSYIKTNNECFLIRAIEQIFLFGHLSPHENICAIALINIHYLYTNFQDAAWKDYLWLEKDYIWV